MSRDTPTAHEVRAPEEARRVPVLIISGPVGVGKTSVAHEMFDQLIPLPAIAHEALTKAGWI
jgi:hypothetical protein